MKRRTIFTSLFLVVSLVLLINCAGGLSAGHLRYHSHRLLFYQRSHQAVLYGNHLWEQHKLLAQIPEARLENLLNLPALLSCAQGEDPDNFTPSDEELLESETGNRIAAICQAATPEQLLRVLASGCIAQKSVRYFYAEKPVAVTIRLQ